MNTPTTQPANDLLTRAGAIENSGWGRSFTFYQPRNAAFWVYLALVVSGAFKFFSLLSSSAGAYGEAIALSLVLFGVYGAIFWWFTQHIDRYARQPVKLIVVAFLWGSFAATWVMAANANDAILSLYAKTFGQAWASDWGPGLTAPFTEEIAKGIGLLLLIALASRLVRTAFDGFILGAFIGLGFQIFEDVLYALNSAASQFGADPVGAAMPTIILRMVFGVAAHTLYSAIFGAGLVYLLGRPAEPRRVGRGLALMATAMLLHGLWDSAGALTQGKNALLFPLFFVMVAAALTLVVRVFRMTVPRERQFLSDILAPEVDRGVITDEEFVALCGDHKARRAFRKSAGGHAARKRAEYVLEAAADLADALADSHGTNTGRVEFARSEVSRIRSGQPSVKL
ncbi:MAG: putative rane protein [Rhodococcus erythropolis]|jgi:RsiW-degrading membrane proteinase PrsW (M82 family)|uniref:PrsW family intramembrane metalloprotease n=1 Tax=Rhodococcus TaxID=1827 RepID=UPI00242D7E73|nr:MULTISPECIES: PrsW family intramembrane metalloprotease [Rhodococcus]MDF2895530.1 putative rane protein [Rhodococcus erythropolis]MDV6208750.1 PrsW family intramembrane metalloprotease [Rhodococcus erythropolis]MDV8010856.1 PrsW family intramembrane metalloprotease [Rhodococcus sp. IEGM 1241]